MTRVCLWSSVATSEMRFGFARLAPSLLIMTEKRFPETLLREWKHEAEELALVWIGKPQSLISFGRATPLVRDPCAYSSPAKR